jgi:hypothetical protein
MIVTRTRAIVYREGWGRTLDVGRGLPPAARERGRKRAAFVGFALLLASPALALPPAADSGPCSLENAVPATIAAIDEDFELLLDDGRRAVVSGVEVPAEPALRAEAAKKFNAWLAGKDIFLAPLGPAPDRWGRTPAAVFAAQGEAADAPLVSAGAALLEAGLARFRPDPPAAPCARAYLDAENAAREARAGLWGRPEYAEIDLSIGDVNRNNERFLNRKGMILVSGVIRSVGETRGVIYLNFGARRWADFAAVILRRDLGMFEQAHIFPLALTGRRARVRGLIETGSGPRMDIASPAALELLDGAPAP